MPAVPATCRLPSAGAIVGTSLPRYGVARGRLGRAAAPAAAFVSASTDRGPPVLPWGQLDPGRGRRGHPHGLPPVEAGRRTDARSLRSAAKPRRPAGSGRRERQPGRPDPAVRGPGPAPVLAAITLVGRCQRRAAVDAVPASGVVGGVHEGPVGPRRSPATLDASTLGVDLVAIVGVPNPAEVTAPGVHDINVR